MNPMDREDNGFEPGGEEGEKCVNLTQFRRDDSTGCEFLPPHSTSHGRLEISHSFPQGHANKVEGPRIGRLNSVFSPKPIAAVGCDVLGRCCKNILLFFILGVCVCVSNFLKGRI